MKFFLVTGIINTLVIMSACATSPGDATECPACDNLTELLVGTKCVPIDQIEICGPDGHAHGSDCHCYNGQQPTRIGSTDYCLQASCQEIEVDLDAIACAEIDQTPLSLTPVLVFQDFEDAHLDLERVTQVDLPSGQESFVHFAGLATEEYAVFLDTPEVLQAFLDEANNPLPAHLMGANSDCQTSLPEVWHAEVDHDSPTARPQIIRFKAGSVDKIKVVVYPLEENGRVSMTHD